MNLDFTTLLGGGAIVASVTLLWDKIKFLFSSLSSFFITSVKVDQQISDAILAYSKNNFKKFKYQPIQILSFLTYIKPIKKEGLVAFRDYCKTSSIFYNSFRFFIIDGGNANDSSNRVDISTITYIRGMFDIEKLIFDSVSYYNNLKSSKMNNKRYAIYNYGGSGGKLSDSGQPEQAPAVIPKYNDATTLMQRGCEILGWKVDELGDVIIRNKIDYLAYPSEVHQLLQDVQQWKDSCDWYKERQIPWRKGYLLYGKPGTGKSALISAIAQSFDFPICSFDLSSMTNNDFKHYWQRARTESPCIVLMEDIDNIFHGRENITKNSFNESLTYDSFLNTISGVQNSDGVLLFITSNNIDHLDEALGKPRTDKHVNGTGISTRPGRIDKVLELKAMDLECRTKLAKRILNDCPEHIEITIKNGDGDTGAQFQERCSQIAIREYWKNK